MDAAKSNRLFPGFTTTELKAKVANVEDASVRAKMEGEIARREAGASNAITVPQLKGGFARPVIGRM
jgi:hypothetical protein